MPPQRLAALRFLRRAQFPVAMGFVVMGAAVSAEEPAFRVRADQQAPLNLDEGWAGNLNEEVTIATDQPFRLRMEVELDDELEGASAYRLQMRRNEGEWETLEAHDFPLPTREIELSFADKTVGSTPPGWVISSGENRGLAVVSEEADRLLRADGRENGLVALYAPPWSPADRTFLARFRLPAENRHGLTILYSYIDAGNHGRVEFKADGMIRAIRVDDGRETVLAEQRANIAPGSWHEAEVQLEGELLQIKFDDDQLEFAVETGPGVAETHMGILVPAGEQIDFKEIIVEGEPRTPGVSIVGTRAYTNGAETTDLLSGSNLRFVPGTGLSLAERTPHSNGGGRHSEFEWPLVIRRFADGPTANEAGDRFEFRMIDEAGEAVSNGPVAKLDLSVPPGHLGGTFVETPGRVGPWQTRNGDLYFIIEPTETDNRFMMMKSTDGGRSWAEVDGTNRPATGDLESVDGRLINGSIHIVQQITESVLYHEFRTSDHPTHPDSWGIRDEAAAEAEAHSQMATLVVRPDGTMVTVFLGDRLHYAIRSADGTWSDAVEIDPDLAQRNAGPQAILGRDGVVHLAYFATDGSLWYRAVLPDDTLTVRRKIAEGAGSSEAEYGAVLPLAFDASTETLQIVYRLADGTIWERLLRADSEFSEPAIVTDRSVITDAVDAQQPAADLVADGETAHVLFVEEASRSIFSTRKEEGIWQEPTLLVDGIKGSWVRGNVIRKPDGSRVLGYVYDAGSEGGAGLNRYAELSLDTE